MKSCGFNIDGATEEDVNGDEDEDLQDTIHEVIRSVIYQLLALLRCMICDNGEQLLCCETCSDTYHLECLDPPLKSIPTGDWLCPQCRYRDPTSKKMLIKLNIGGSKTSVQMAGSDKPSKKKLIKLNIGGSKTAVQTASNVKPSLMFGSANHGASVSGSRGEIRNKCKSGTSPPSLLPCKAHAIISSVFDKNKNASGCFAGKVDPCIIFSSSVSHFNDKSSTL